MCIRDRCCTTHAPDSPPRCGPFSNYFGQTCLLSHWFPVRSYQLACHCSLFNSCMVVVLVYVQVYSCEGRLTANRFRTRLTWTKLRAENLLCLGSSIRPNFLMTQTLSPGYCTNTRTNYCSRCTGHNVYYFTSVSYTHLTLPTNREV